MCAPAQRREKKLIRVYNALRDNGFSRNMPSPNGEADRPEAGLYRIHGNRFSYSIGLFVYVANADGCRSFELHAVGLFV